MQILHLRDAEYTGSEEEKQRSREANGEIEHWALLVKRNDRLMDYFINFLNEINHLCRSGSSKLILKFSILYKTKTTPRQIILPSYSDPIICFDFQSFWRNHSGNLTALA